MLLLATALMLGFLHAVEVDHMIAVTTFVSRKPAYRTAAAFGLRWGIGHSVAVLLVGGALVVLGLRWPGRYDQWGETAVGLVLIGLGVWAFWSGRKLHLHPAEEHGGHAHLHIHDGGGGPPHHHGHADHQHEHDHHARSSDQPHAHGGRRGITWVGVLHGLAGTGGVVALLPVTLIGQKPLALAYLATFGVGTTAGMVVFALVAAGAMRQAAGRSLHAGQLTTRLAGVAGVGVGAWWVVRAWS